MIITIPIQKENDDGLLSNQNGLTDLTLRAYPFTSDTYSLTPVAGVNGRYESTQSITASGLHKLYKGGIEQKSYGGNNGVYIFSEVNQLDVNDFNVGETLVCESLSGQKYFVPTSLTGAVSQAVIDSISAGVVNSFPKIWLGQVHFVESGEGADMIINVFKNDIGEDIRVTQLNNPEESQGRYFIYTPSNVHIFNSKTFFTFLETVDGNAGGYVYEVSSLGFSTSSELEIDIKEAGGITGIYPTKSVIIKIEVYP